MIYIINRYGVVERLCVEVRKQLMVEKTLLQCMVVENGIVKEIIDLLDDILKTCSFARIKLNWHSLLTAGQFSKQCAPRQVSSRSVLIVCLPWRR